MKNMNILIPDSWLRQYLKTDATPADIQKCLSLCGPSVERIYDGKKDPIYDIEITTNRVDAFCVYGIAREASVILPTFGFKAKLKEIPPYLISDKLPKLDLDIIDSDNLCQRILAVKIANVLIKDSPISIKNRLEQVGQRPLNNVVDITNYIMWEFGQPVHVFDYDKIKTKKLIVRLSQKGESLITLDNKKHNLIGGELIFDDGHGTIIDLPSIMGTLNTSVTKDTKNILIFIESTDPNLIRFASMSHAIRTQAAIINEKGPDPESALLSIREAAAMTLKLTGGKLASKLYDKYQVTNKSKPINVSKNLIDQYLGQKVDDSIISDILKKLGFIVDLTLKPDDIIFKISAPSWRRTDIAIPEDIIEEIARIYGYHNIESKLPQTNSVSEPMNPMLLWEQDLKILLKNAGFTEIYPYSMLSEDQIRIFDLNPHKIYKISNPLSSDWIYMRPTLMPTMLNTVSKNVTISKNLKLFEISMIYEYREGKLPLEKPAIIISQTGDKFREIKGMAELIFKHMGIHIPTSEKNPENKYYQPNQYLTLGKYGHLGPINHMLLNNLNIKDPVFMLELDLTNLINDANIKKIYKPISKYPPSFEDLAFIVPNDIHIGILIEKIKKINPLVADVTLLDSYKNIRTLHITYQSFDNNLTAADIKPIREKILMLAETKYSARLRES